jgi:hypothetical protein
LKNSPTNGSEARRSRHDRLAGKPRPTLVIQANAFDVPRHYAVAVNVFVLDDDLAEIDADAELDAALLRNAPSLSNTIARATLENSTKSPSPVVLTMRPRCRAILGSAPSRRSALNAV